MLFAFTISVLSPAIPFTYESTTWVAPCGLSGPQNPTPSKLTCNSTRKNQRLLRKHFFRCLLFLGLFYGGGIRYKYFLGMGKSVIIKNMLFLVLQFFSPNVAFPRNTHDVFHFSTEINFPIIPYTLPPMYTTYTTSANFSGIQLTSTVGSFHTSPFQIMV